MTYRQEIAAQERGFWDDPEGAAMTMEEVEFDLEELAELQGDE